MARSSMGRSTIRSSMGRTGSGSGSRAIPSLPGGWTPTNGGWGPVATPMPTPSPTNGGGHLVHVEVASPTPPTPSGNGGGEDSRIPASGMDGHHLQTPMMIGGGAGLLSPTNGGWGGVHGDMATPTPTNGGWGIVDLGLDVASPPPTPMPMPMPTPTHTQAPTPANGENDILISPPTGGWGILTTTPIHAAGAYLMTPTNGGWGIVSPTTPRTGL